MKNRILRLDCASVYPGPAAMTRVCLAVLIVAGCGDPLVDADYRGRPLLSLQGPLLMPDGSEFIESALCFQEEVVCVERAAMNCGISLDAPVSEEACPGLYVCQEALDQCLADEDLGDLLTASDYVLRLSLFWAPTAEVAGPEDEAVEQQSVSTASLPARYALTLYRPPPVGVLHEGEGGHYGLAVIVAYYDTDNDGRYDPRAEPLLGGTPEHAILYTPNGVEDPILGTWPAGYHVVRVDPCDPAATGDRYQSASGRLVPVELSGSAPFPRDLMPDSQCQDDPDWWEEFCDEATRWQCSQGHQDPGQCEFCGFPFEAEESSSEPGPGEGPGPGGEPTPPDDP